MMNKYKQEPREIDVLGCYDVIVAGGGPSGCAAAISAARHGMNVLLLEKDGFLGGATVSQSVIVILSTNGVDFQGIWHEYMNKLKERKGVYEDEFNIGKAHFNGCIDPEIVKYVWDDLIKEAGVNLLHHCMVIDAIIEDDIIKGVVVATRAGRKAIFAKRIIDATGDGIVCEYAGVLWDQGANGEKYAMALTKVFRMGNVPNDAGPKTQEEYDLIRINHTKAVERGEFTHPIITSGRVLWYIGIKNITWRMPKHRAERMLVTSRVLKVDPLDPYEFSEAEREGREQVWEIMKFFRKYVPGCENIYLVETNQQIGVRSSRRVHGIEKVYKEDALNFNKYEDSIAKTSWDIDVWPSDSYTAAAVDRESEMYASRHEKLNKGEYFDIRYGCIVAKNIDNLFMVGRCISADHIAESSLRIQQTCMSTGQAAGLAAAISIKDDVYPRLVNVKKVIKQVENDRKKVDIAFNKIKIAYDYYAKGESRNKYFEFEQINE